MKKIMFCGGGSAGHVMPNIALIEILAREYEICYVGTDGIEKSICESRNVKFYQFDGVKLVRGKILCNLAIPFKLIKSVRQCKKILKAARPDLLFSKGGYASLPPAVAADKLAVPVITHESDLTVGLANKFIAYRSEAVLTSFPSTAKNFGNGEFVGSPMRESLFNRDRAAARRKFSLDDRPSVLFFGGGSGSEIINRTLRKALFGLCKKYNVLHVCGRGNAAQNNLYGYTQIEFCDDMGELYAATDYAVARCGSNSAHELIALKIPTLFIPLANGSSRGDQVLNAQFFKSSGLCEVLAEKDLTPQTLKASVENLIANEKIKSALQSCAVECGNDKIIEIIKRTLSQNALD